jgi:hypothetical protein
LLKFFSHCRDHQGWQYEWRTLVTIHLPASLKPGDFYSS